MSINRATIIASDLKDEFEHLPEEDYLRVAEKVNALSSLADDNAERERMLEKANLRAVEMLKIAAEYIETHWPDGLIKYDETECDGYCVAEDCRVAAEMLETEE